MPRAADGGMTTTGLSGFGPALVAVIAALPLIGLGWVAGREFKAWRIMRAEPRDASALVYRSNVRASRTYLVMGNQFFDRGDIEAAERQYRRALMIEIGRASCRERV